MPLLAVDWLRKAFDNEVMSIDATNDLVQEIQQTLERASADVRNPVELRQAREEMNRVREELRQKIGVVDVAVELIRDARNQ